MRGNDDAVQSWNPTAHRHRIESIGMSSRTSDSGESVEATIVDQIAVLMLGAKLLGVAIVHEGRGRKLATVSWCRP